MADLAEVGDTGPIARASLRVRQRQGTARFLPRRATLAVLAAGLIVTGVLTTLARVNFPHNEQRLASLQTNLTADALGIAPVDLERRLGQALAAAAASPNPASSYRQELAASMAPKGSFGSAGLALVEGRSVRILTEFGAKPLHPLTTPAESAKLEQLARSPVLYTSRVVGPDAERLTFALSERTGHGALVGFAAQLLPGNRLIKIAPSSPDYGFNVAIYFGKTTSPSALLVATTKKLPISGTVAMSRVPFGTSVLTLVMAPKGPLAGTWPDLLPWAILAIGLLFTVGIAALVERLSRRRAESESLAGEVRQLYYEQRAVAETLQRSLLPKEIPEMPGMAFASRYLSSQHGSEIGGDWYSIVAIDSERFAFLVGDVSGHGVSAAAMMGALRNSTQAYASLGHAPDAVLQLAARDIYVSRDSHFATVLVGVVNNATRQLQVASAGHYAPILVEGGKARYLEVPIGPPLGVSDHAYEVATHPIPPGSMLIAFTDGLVERRDEPIDTSLERLRSRASRDGLSIEMLLVELLNADTDVEREDDVAMVAMQWLN